MASLDLPKLRPLSCQAYQHGGQSYVVFIDPHEAFADPVLVPAEWYHWIVRHFDGATPPTEIQARVLRQTGNLVTTENLARMIEQLDRAMVLDGPTFAAFREEFQGRRTRPAAHAGRSYAGTEKALRAQLAQFFADERGAGLPTRDGSPSGPTSLRGILSPHIDFQRGGPVYTHSYRELVENSDADIFVILGVAHQPCRHRFALTRKDFETPLGLARTNLAYVDRIAALAGEHLFDDELAHRTEHSVEFQVVFLQYLLNGRRDFSIVPILVGSFHDFMTQNIDPIADPEVSRFVSALRAAEVASGQRVAYIGGIDLGHIGPEFGDPQRVDNPTLERLRRFDAEMLDRASASDPAGWFGKAAEVDNRWRTCGLAATYTLLHTLGPVRGRLLQYDQAVNPERTCCVSFASLAFLTPEPTSIHADSQPD